ncbi:hypothetical protein [Indioceanicola profundi]|uniref:hypothetical protein n=1 Tax=Indioceanicola profundi TaxID=2220096 RepID=UPI000E6A9792|nr:hypothetical protein [Indioceanicola profundi]
MKTFMTLAIAVGGILAFGPAQAQAQSCGERIAELETVLDEKAEASISASSGGQGVAGAREGVAVNAENQDEPVEAPAVPYQEPEEEEEAVEQAEEAGGGGDRVLQAKAKLNQARSFDQEGNTTACEEAVAEVEQVLEAD